MRCRWSYGPTFTDCEFAMGVPAATVRETVPEVLVLVPFLDSDVKLSAAVKIG